jgi:hypothetical protein
MNHASLAVNSWMLACVLPSSCRSYMKLRLDRVLRYDLGALPDSEVLAVGGEVPKFSVSPNWTAPYPAYSPGWWEKFYPGAK